MLASHPSASAALLAATFLAAGPLPDEDYDEFAFMSYLSSDLTAGSTLYLPAVQECTKGVLRWIDKPSGNAAADHVGTPAPALALLPDSPDVAI